MKIKRFLVAALTVTALAVGTPTPAAAKAPAGTCTTERGVKTCTTTTTGTESLGAALGTYPPPQPACGDPQAWLSVTTHYERPYTDTTTTQYQRGKVTSQRTDRTYGDPYVSGTDYYCHQAGA